MTMLTLDSSTLSELARVQGLVLGDSNGGCSASNRAPCGCKCDERCDDEAGGNAVERGRSTLLRQQQQSHCLLSRLELAYY